MLKRFFAVFSIFFIILFVGWLTMQRADISIAALESRYGYPDSRYVTLPELDVGLHFRDIGPVEAPILLLLHGFSSSVHTWEKLLPDLTKQYRVIALDLPGHGLTSGPTDAGQVNVAFYVAVVERFLDKAGIDDTVALMGSSMGGRVSQSFAIQNPNIVSAMVLLGSSGAPSSAKEERAQPAIFRLMRLPLIAKLVQNMDMTLLIRQGLRSAFYDKRLVDRQMVERYVYLSLGEGHRRILIAMQNASRDSFDTTKLAELDIPVLVIHGAEDAIMPPDHAHQLANLMPNATLHLLPEVGHLPHQEAPQMSLDLIQPFLQSSLEFMAVSEINGAESVPDTEPAPAQ